MPLVINAFGGAHTHRHMDTQTHIPTRTPNQFQETRRALRPRVPGLKPRYVLYNEFMGLL